MPTALGWGKMERLDAPLAPRRTLLLALGGLAAAHVTGCAAPARRGRPSSWPEPVDSSPTEPAAPGPVETSSDAVASSRAGSEVPGVEGPPLLDLPDRPRHAESGSAFLARTEGLGRAAMDAAILEAILSGNVPAYERRLVPITVAARGASATLHVACDYLAIGSDEDFVRMPMTSAAAQTIADHVDATLPTPKLVDEIYRQAEARLPPSWIDGGPTYGTLADYAAHNLTLEERRKERGIPLGVLTAGHKKDIVLCEKLLEHPDHVAIYGWHKREGVVVQPVSTLHSCRYADYSHGVRLVAQRVTIDGEPHRASDLLRDPAFAYLLSDEGPLSVTEYSTELPPYPPDGGRRARG